MKKNAKEMMSRIAALLPDENHRICSGDYKIKDYQDQNGIMPKLIDF